MKGITPLQATSIIFDKMFEVEGAIRTLREVLDAYIVENQKLKTEVEELKANQKSE